MAEHFIDLEQAVVRFSGIYSFEKRCTRFWFRKDRHEIHIYYEQGHRFKDFEIWFGPDMGLRDRMYRKLADALIRHEVASQAPPSAVSDDATPPA